MDEQGAAERPHEAYAAEKMVKNAVMPLIDLEPNVAG